MKTIVNYAQKVKEQHALNKTLAPVETDLTSASKAYAVGQKFIHDGVLYQAKTAIAQGAALVLNTNYEAADDVSTEIEALTNKLADEVSARAELGAHNWLILDDSLFRGKEADTSYTSLSTGIEITNAASGTYRVCSWWIKNLKPNTDYILSSNVTKVSGTGRMFVRDSDSGTILCDTQNISDSKKVSLSFNTGTSTNLYIALYSSTATAAIGDIKYENLLIRLASDPDDTYQQYAKTNQELTAENQTLTNNVDVLIDNGAVNHLPTNAVTQTIYGVTFTVNDDKSVSVSTDSDGATADAVFPLCYNIKIKSGMIFKGCPSDGDVSKYFMVIEETSSPYTRYALDSGEGGEISASSDGNNVAYIRVKSGQILTTPITFKPMIADADYTGGYVPYAMTNRELTDKVVKSSKIDLPSTSIAVGSTETITIPASSLPSDFHNALAIIPISVGPEGWSTTLPGVFTNVNLTNLTVSVRAYTAQNFAPTVILLYV